MNNIKTLCVECKCWKQNVESPYRGKCHRHAPTAVNEYGLSFMPTEHNDFCFEGLDAPVPVIDERKGKIK